jgi:hypothetical protein
LSESHNKQKKRAEKKGQEKSSETTGCFFLSPFFCLLVGSPKPFRQPRLHFTIKETMVLAFQHPMVLFGKDDQLAGMRKR